MRRWIVDNLTAEEAGIKYLGRQFKVKFSSTHEVIVQVDHVQLYGGVVRTFCSLVKTVKRDKKARHRVTFDRQEIYAGRLESIGDAA